MYFEDLTPYAYTQARLPSDAPSLVNFGWLDSDHDYPRGKVAPEVVERMLRLAAERVNGMRGYHRCPFCEEREQVSMLLEDEIVYLGSAEIHIKAGSTTYVAPNLLPHYMEAHEYMPPEQVLQALDQ
jgi:hypothetical protein